MDTMTATTEGRSDAMISVRDGDREIRFDGRLLGAASSERPGKDRWIEISIFCTSSGKYIVSGVGRTNLTHESDRFWAHISETAQGAVESLHLYDEDRVRYLTKVADRALRLACQNDPALHDAHFTQVVD